MNDSKITVPIKIENAYDLEAFELGEKKQDQIRQLTITALVDTNAWLLYLDPDSIKQLSLRFFKEIPMATATGIINRRVFRNAFLTILDRSCPIEVIEINGKNPALVGRLPLDTLDLVIDPQTRTVISNPEHKGEMVLDLF